MKDAGEAPCVDCTLFSSRSSRRVIEQYLMARLAAGSSSVALARRICGTPILFLADTVQTRDAAQRC